MDQLLNSLSEEGVLENADISAIASSTDLSRDVAELAEDGQQDDLDTDHAEQNGETAVEDRVARCKERQVELESRFEILQNRISALRGYQLGKHAAHQIQLGVMCCEKKVARGKTVSPTHKQTPAQPSSTKPVKVPQRRSKLRDVSREQTDKTFNTLYAHIKHVQKFADADATESSSGGESADEHEQYPAGAKFYAPIKERAKYRWLQRRSEHGSQWGWIQSQISDLEFKIRQQTEMYKAYREAKGAVTLAEPPRNQNKRKYDGEASSEDDSTCSRTRPVSRFKRRKLLDTYSIHHVNQKLNKPSSVICSCVLPDEWCVLCLGRRHSRLTADIHTQSREECTALLDHSYHTVLSSQNSVPISDLLTEAAFKKGWFHTTSNATKQPIPSHLSKLFDITKKLEEQTEEGQVKKKVRKKREERKKKRRKINISTGQNQKDGIDCDAKDGKEITKIRDIVNIQDDKKKKRRNSFDIDHVVIPYNMSTTRVQKPKYKEIMTPSWRVVDVSYPWPPKGSIKRLQADKCPEEPPKPCPQDPDFEDISTLAISLLHAKAEEEERIRWTTPLGRVHGGQRTRANRARRLDSCVTEASSEANTPDPLSPGFIDRVEDIVVQTRPSSPQDESYTPMLTSPAHNFSLHISSDKDSIGGSTTNDTVPGNTTNESTVVDATSDKAIESATRDTAVSESSKSDTAASGSTTIATAVAGSTGIPTATEERTANNPPLKGSNTSDTAAAAGNSSDIAVVGVTASDKSTEGCSTYGTKVTASTNSDTGGASSETAVGTSTDSSDAVISQCATDTISNFKSTNTGNKQAKVDTSSASLSSSTDSSLTVNSLPLNSSSLSITPVTSVNTLTPKTACSLSGTSVSSLTATSASSLTTTSGSSLTTTSGSSLTATSVSSLTATSVSSLTAVPSTDSLTSHLNVSSLTATNCTNSLTVQIGNIGNSLGCAATDSASVDLREASHLLQNLTDYTATSLKIRRRTTSQNYKMNRNRNLSEASQESSRCTSPDGDGGSSLPGFYEMRQFPLTDEQVKMLEEEDNMMKPPPPPSNTSSSNNLQINQSISNLPVAVASSNVAAASPRTPTPPPAAVSCSAACTSGATSRNTSRTTSRSSSICDEQDPDWEDQGEESEPEL